MTYLIISNFVLLVLLACVAYSCFRRGRLESALQRLIDHTNVGYYRYRVRDGVVISANKGFVRILDLDVGPADVVGRSMSELIIYLDDTVSIREQVRMRGGLNNFEYRFKTLKGKDKNVIHNAYMMVDPYTREEIVVALIEDVTEERASYEKMRQSQERYEKLFKSSGDMVAIFRLSDLGIEEVNPVTEIMTAFEQEEILGKTFDELIHPSRRDIFRDCKSDLLFSGSASLETVIVRKDGGYRDVILTMNAIDIREHRVVLVMVKDVSSFVRGKKEEDLRKKELEEFWKASVEREDRINELRGALDKAQKKLRALEEKNGN
jgi:PAS domain S-box-containing protein